MARGPSTKPGKILLVLGLLVLAYLGGYILARATHGIVHTSNYRHWHPEKRSPEHFVGSDFHVRLSCRALNLLYKPLRLLEEKYHNAANCNSMN